MSKKSCLKKNRADCMNGNACFGQVQLQQIDNYTLFSRILVVICSGLGWFVVVCLHRLWLHYLSSIVPSSGGDLWWFAVMCGGLWWFAVVCGGLRWFVF